MNISKSVTPPGGWKYKEGSHWLYGDHYEDLVATLMGHRLNNKFEMGDPEKDIEDQILSNFPYLRVNIIKMESDGS